MVRIIQAPPDPRWQSFLDYVSRLQEERYRREQERAQEREAQKQRTIAGIGLGLGAVGGVAIAGAMAPAAVASASGMGALAAGTPMTAAGTAAGLSTMGAISAGLTGAAVGGQMAQQFGAGDIAGGVTTAAGAARGVMQTMEDQKLYGYSPSPQERAAYAKLALKSGTSMGQLRGMALQSDSTIPQLLQAYQIAGADAERKQGMLTDAGIMMSVPEFDEAAARHPGGDMGIFLDMQSQVGEFKAQMAGKKAFAQRYNSAKAEIQIAGELERMEGHIPQHAISEKDQRIEDIHEAWQMGELSDAQAIQQFDRYVGPPLRRVQTPRQTTPTWQELVPKQLGIAQLPMPDGTQSPPMIIRQHPPTPRSPEGEIEFVRWVSEDEDLTEAILKHYESLVKSTFDPSIPMSKAAENVAQAKRIAKEMEAGTFKPQQVIRPSVPSRPVARPGQPAPVRPQMPARPAKSGLQQQVEIAADLLMRLAKDFPDVAKWTPEMREQFIPPAVFLNKIFLERLRRGELLTPEETKLARFVKKIVEGS